MKRISVVITIVGILIIGAMQSCSAQTVPSLVNELSFDVKEFKNLKLDYDADDIHVYESDTSNVILKEYMNENKKNYYARITTNKNGELRITEGKRPKRSSFQSYIEIYIPKNYTKNLSLHTTSGTIKSEIAMNLLGVFSVDTTSGVIEISNVRVSNLQVISTNGYVSFENIVAGTMEIHSTNAITSIKQATGILNYESTGGKLIATELSGSGWLKASGEGSIDISFKTVKNNLFIYSKNGNLTLGLPNDLAFEFSATTKGGSINTTFSDLLAVIDNTAIGTIGSFSEILIEMETRNGNIKVIR